MRKRASSRGREKHQEWEQKTVMERRPEATLRVLAQFPLPQFSTSCLWAVAWLTHTHTHVTNMSMNCSSCWVLTTGMPWLQLDYTSAMKHTNTHMCTHKQHRACPPGFGVFSNNRAFEKYLKAFTISSLIFPTVYIYHICRMFLNAACNQVKLVDSLCSPVFSVFNLSVCVNVWWKHFLSFRQRKK